MIDSIIWLLVGAGVGGLLRIWQWVSSAPLPTDRPISLPPSKQPREIVEVPRGFELDRPR